MFKPLPIDSVKSTRWAIGEVASASVMVGSANVYELVNVETLRAHPLGVAAFTIGEGLVANFGASIDGGFLPSAMPDYNYFTTRRPVSFDDFHGNGARITGLDAGMYSISWLTVFEGPAYVSNRLLYERFDGFGVGIPSFDLGHGVTSVLYGSGQARGPVWNHAPRIEMRRSVEEVKEKLRLTQQEHRIAIELPADLLFDFNLANLKPGAVDRLRLVAMLIGMSRRLKRIEVVGHTDSVGKVPYNDQLSERRARAVVDWLVTSGGLRPSILRTTVEGVGSRKPVAPNTLPGGRDNPAGREKNRRVVIYLWFKEPHEPDTWTY